MTTEENKRMLALSYIIADMKAENLELEQRVHQLMGDYNEAVRQLTEQEKRKEKDEDSASQRQQIIDYLNKLKKENGELERFAKVIYTFVRDKNLYVKKAMNCPYYQDRPHSCSTFSLECDSCLGIIEGCGVICEKRLAEACVTFSNHD